jgi:crossover junction endodeoxyribonuclease RuvC
MDQPEMTRIVGIDPGLRRMGWGVVETMGSRLSFVACGTVAAPVNAPLPTRLRILHEALAEILRAHAPHEVAVEETFVNRDPQSALKLGEARGIALVVPALAGLEVFEYAANLIKKTVTGSGHAEKTQVAAMVKVLLPRCEAKSFDAADALAAAITHAQHRRNRALVASANPRRVTVEPNPSK